MPTVEAAGTLQVTMADRITDGETPLRAALVEDRPPFNLNFLWNEDCWRPQSDGSSASDTHWGCKDADHDQNQRTKRSLRPMAAREEPTMIHQRKVEDARQNHWRSQMVSGSRFGPEDGVNADSTFGPEDGVNADSESRQEVDESGQRQFPAEQLESQEQVTVVGSNGTSDADASAILTLQGLTSGSKKSRVVPEEVLTRLAETDGHKLVAFGRGDGSMKLPIWIIIKLKVRVARARNVCNQRREKTRVKRAFNPESRGKMYWDAMTTLLLIYTLFEIPFHMAFWETSCQMAAIDYFNLFVDVIFTTDIFVTFNTGFIDRIKGEDILIDSHVAIAQRYLKGWFCVDVVSSLPLDVIICSALSGDGQDGGGMGIVRVFKVARFLKLARLVRFIRMLNKWQSMSTSAAVANSVRLFKLVVGLLMSAHLMGCGWEFARVFQDCGRFTDASLAEDFADMPGMTFKQIDPDGRYGCECYYSKFQTTELKGTCEPLNWMSKYDADLHDNGPVSDRYIACVYFTIIGLSTVGFGDISPATDTERVVSTLYTLIGAVVFALVIGSISEIAQRNNKFEESVASSVHAIADFLEHRNVPSELNLSIIRQVKFASARAPHQFARDEIFQLFAPSSILPRHLRLPLMKHLLQEQQNVAVASFPFFQNLDVELGTLLLLVLRPVLLNEGEYLYNALDSGRDIYVLVSGSLNKLVFVNQFGLMSLSPWRFEIPGDIIGEVGLIPDGPPFRISTVQASNRVELLELRQTDFAFFEEQYPDFMCALTDMVGSYRLLLTLLDFDVRAADMVVVKSAGCYWTDFACSLAGTSADGE